jgi:hypothetical protein
MRRIADGEEYTTPATIDDPAVLDEMRDALVDIGYARDRPKPLAPTEAGGRTHSSGRGHSVTST